jgi:hypothetical protein
MMVFLLDVEFPSTTQVYSPESNILNPRSLNLSDAEMKRVLNIVVLSESVCIMLLTHFTCNGGGHDVPMQVRITPV